MKSIRPNPGQPRKTFDSEQLEVLKQSIETHGLIQPIAVRELDGGLYEIISGERRWRAARLAGLQTIPVIVLQADDQLSLELAIVENVQRRDLDPIEKAKGFQVLVQQFGLSHETIGARIGLDRSSVANHIRLLELPKEVQEGLTVGLLSMGHARALLGVPDGPARLALFERTVREELSVREVERLVKDRTAAPPALPVAGASQASAPSSSPSGGSAAGAPGRALPRPEPWQATLEQRIRDHLGARVELQKGKGFRGRIIVHFNGREDLERLADLLGPKDLL